MENIFKRCQSLYDVPTHYCPGCGHGVVHRVLMEVVDTIYRDHLFEVKKLHEDDLAALRIAERNRRRAPVRSQLGRGDMPADRTDHARRHG